MGTKKKKRAHKQKKTRAKSDLATQRDARLRQQEGNGIYTGMMLAKEIGVSPMTVSLVLNQKPGPSDETRQLVLEAAAKRGYQPHAAAKVMAYQRHGLSRSAVVAIIAHATDERVKFAVQVVHLCGRLSLWIPVDDPQEGYELANTQKPELIINMLSVTCPVADKVYELGSRAQHRSFGPQLAKLLEVE